MDENGQLRGDGAFYDLDALREERERRERRNWLEPGELGPREWAQDRTPEEFEDRVFSEMFRWSVKAGQTLYGELTPREASDWERLERLTKSGVPRGGQESSRTPRPRATRRRRRRMSSCGPR